MRGGAEDRSGSQEASDFSVTLGPRSKSGRADFGSRRLGVLGRSLPVDVSDPSVRAEEAKRRDADEAKFLTVMAATS